MTDSGRLDADRPAEDSALIPKDQVPEKPVDASLSLRLLKSAGYCLNFFALGVVIGELGPCLPDLALRTGAGFEMLAWIFTARSVGYLIGSGIIGYALARWDGAPLLITTLGFGGILTAAVPVSSELSTVVMVVTVQGLFWGGVDTLGNCLMIETHGENCHPFMQALHFSFAVGAFVAPLAVKPFISPHDPVSHDIVNANPKFPWSFYVAALTVIPAILLQLFIWARRGFRIPKDIPASAAPKAAAQDESSEAKSGAKVVAPQKAALVRRHLAASAARAKRMKHTMSAPNVLAMLRREQMRRNQTSFPQNMALAEDDGLDEQQQAFLCFRYFVIFLTSFFLFLYVGSEHGYQSWIYSYAVSADGLGISSDHGALLNSGFWGFFSFGRLIAIPISIYMSPPAMMFIDLIGCQLSLILLWVYPGSEMVFWVGTAILGVSMASVYPTAINMCETYIDVTGYAATCFVFGSSVGQMSMPLIIGLLFHLSPLWLIYVLFVICASANLVFWIMWKTGTTHSQSKLVKLQKESSDLESINA